MKIVLDKQRCALLSNSENDPILLSELVKKEYTSLNGSSCNLHIMIPFNVSVQIIDDLHQCGLYDIHLFFDLEKKSTLNYRCRMINDYRKEKSGKKIAKTLSITFQGLGAKAEVICLCLGAGKQEFVFETMQYHKAPQTESVVQIKGVLLQAAQLLCTNHIRIEKGAKKVVAREENKNLLLGNEAHVVTLPKMEVAEHDVIACHGATISRLNEEQFFYMQSRGLDQDHAQNVLIDAFLT